MRKKNTFYEMIVFSASELTLDGNPVAFTSGLLLVADHKDARFRGVLIIEAGNNSEIHASTRFIAELMRVDFSNALINGIEAGSLVISWCGIWVSAC